MTVNHEGVAFNAQWAASKTEAAFIEHESHHGLSRAQLSQAYKRCKEAVKPAQKEHAQPAVGDGKLKSAK